MSELPRSIGRYCVARLLNDGLMGPLYLALEPNRELPIAVKLFTHFTPDSRFGREARARARLQHPCIVAAREIGEHDGRLFVAMEYVQGPTISTVVSERRSLTIDLRLALLEQVCDALAYVHRSGVVHRDVKPANLMIDDRNGLLKVLGFNLTSPWSFLVSAMPDRLATTLTLNYVAPELMNGGPVDHRCDMFSVGCVLYELLSFEQAFPGDIPGGLVHRLVHEAPRPLRTLVPDLDPAIERIVSRAIEKGRERRYPDMDAMRSDIAAARKQLAH